MAIVGTWYNELGSTLEITDVTDGLVTGTYTTAVSGSACAQGSFALTGRTDIDAEGGATGNIGFVVSWENAQSTCNSVTAWSGQLLNGQIVAFWLLTIENEPSWQATNIGMDTFTQNAPNTQHAGAATQSMRRSHP